MSILKLYHGSDHFISTPEHGVGKSWNDYGKGFYCTESVELAKEWACSEEGKNGYIIDPYNTQEFAKYIETVLADKAICEKMQEQSDKVIDKFRFANIAKGYVAAIEECL